jgi:threonylcarbamoyladenosine tRNA methylthiotransferase MtaB
MKVAFHTLGCKVNMYETNGMIQKFEEAGYELVNFNDFADIYVVNTCTVTSISDKKSRQFLRQAKKINPNGIIIATRMLCTSF